MKLYTIQMAKWRRTPDGAVFKDITYKSGDRDFAPSSALLWSYKNGNLSDEAYTAQYLYEMRESFQTNKEKWLSLVNEDSVAIACYCTPHKFCHRLLLKDILEKVAKSEGLPFEYLGEVE